MYRAAALSFGRSSIRLEELKADTRPHWQHWRYYEQRTGVSILVAYGHKNFELNSSIAIRDVYRLFLVFSGDQQLFDLAPASDDPLRLMRDDHFTDEIVHLLIGTAVANRVHAEHMSHLRSDPSQPMQQPVTLRCGLLQPDILNSGQEIPLTFEQACNKIIHALHIVPDCGNPAENPLTSEVQLRGYLGKSAWSACLNIPQYVRASILNFRNRV